MKKIFLLATAMAVSLGAGLSEHDSARAANVDNSANAPAAATSETSAPDDTVNPRQTAAGPKTDSKQGELAEIVVITTGTRSPKAVDKIPGAITVITPAEVAYTEALTEDATAVLARTVPGYSESEQTLQGNGETLRGRVPLREFDGVPQGTALRYVARDGTFTDMGIVDHVEVINGPSAAEGVGAAGGIINYISKTPTKEGDVFTVDAHYSTQFEPDSGSYKGGMGWAHKSDSIDNYLAISYIDRGMSWDGDGRRISVGSGGALIDTREYDIFDKFGYNFGEDNSQRLQLIVSKFYLQGKNDYVIQYSPGPGIPDTSIPGQLVGGKAPFNDFWQVALKYQNTQFFGGFLSVDAYKADDDSAFVPGINGSKQDPLIAPIGTLVDQSELTSSKKGLRTSWTRPNILGVEGLELHTGIDLSQDVAAQILLDTHRIWVPPMHYKDWAPYLQLTWDIGPLTLSGGFRRDNGTLQVNSFTTLYTDNREFVQGGTIDYRANLPNLGAIWRFNKQLSAFVSWTKGFSLPEVGSVIRDIDIPGQSISQLNTLSAVIVQNKEVGLNWRSANVAASVSLFDSTSAFGSTVTADPVTGQFGLDRAPVEIKGIEFSGTYNISDAWKASAVYARAQGYTTFVPGGPQNEDIGVLDINPDKLVTTLSWKFSERGNMTLDETTLFSRTLNRNTSAYEHTSGYTLSDFAMNYDTGRFGRLTLGIENMLNRNYVLSLSQLEIFGAYAAGRGRVVTIGDHFEF